MNRTPGQPDKFSQKWRRAGEEAQRRVAGKPLPRLMWENAVRKEAVSRSAGDFDAQTAFAAWLQGWTEAELQNQMRPRNGTNGNFQFKKGPRTPAEIDALRHRISQLIELSPGAEDMKRYNQVYDDRQYIYAAHVVNVLDWALGNLSTEELLSESHLDWAHLRRILGR
jgi:hypothetical protein